MVSQVKNNVDASSAEDAILKTVTFKYDGKTYKKADEDAKKGIEVYCAKDKDTMDGNKKIASKDIQYYKNGKVYNIVKMDVYVQLEESDGKVPDKFSKGVKIEKTVNYSITVND